MNQYHIILAKILQKVNIPHQIYGKFFGYRDYTRFAIIGYARTGSNYLANGITSSKSARIYHEIFADHNREIGKNFEGILSTLYRKQNREIRAVGFKLFYYHLTDDEWTRFLSQDEFRIIHLTRQNRLRTIVSLDIAFKTNQWTSGIFSIKPRSGAIHLNSRDLIGRIEEIEQYENITRERFKNRPLIEVSYEDVTKNPIEQFVRIGQFLNITGFNLEMIGLKKQNKKRLGDLVENFDEVSQALEKTRFAAYLDDQD